MSRSDDDFLSRWSRRKRQPADADFPAAPPDDEVEVELDAEVATVPDPDADRLLLEKLGLKDPDDLLPGDDFAVFLRAAIPNHLKQRALRRLWGSNPVLANLDGLNDYDGDFTGGGVGPGQLKTAYEVGKGFARDLLINEESEDLAEAKTDAETDDLVVVDEEEEHEAAEPNDVLPANVRRRMSFRFDKDV